LWRAPSGGDDRFDASRPALDEIEDERASAVSGSPESAAS